MFGTPEVSFSRFGTPEQISRKTVGAQKSTGGGFFLVFVFLFFFCNSLDYRLDLSLRPGSVGRLGHLY